MRYRGTSLIRNLPNPRTTMRPYCRVLGGGCFLCARCPCSTPRPVLRGVLRNPLPSEKGTTLGGGPDCCAHPGTNFDSVQSTLRSRSHRVSAIAPGICKSGRDRTGYLRKWPMFGTANRKTVSSLSAAECRGNNLKGFEDFYLKRPESGLDCLTCAKFSRQR